LFADGVYENFDQLPYLEYRELGRSNSEPQQRQDSLTLREALDMISECLQNYQSWFDRPSGEPWRVCFPFSRYLRQGAKVYNLTTNSEYIIKQKIDPGIASAHWINDNVVELEGEIAPLLTDRLRLDRELLVDFYAAYPKSFASTYKFEGGGLVADDNAGPWKDTVTYLITRSEPGSFGDRYFQSPREVKPRFRRVQEITDKGYLATVFGKCEDNLVQFDCWSIQNDRADEILEWLKGFFELYTGVFKWNGLQDVSFWDRGVDELSTRWRADIVNRTLRYVLRTEAITAHIHRKLSAVQIFTSLTGEIGGGMAQGQLVQANMSGEPSLFRS